MISSNNIERLLKIEGEMPSSLLIEDSVHQSHYPVMIELMENALAKDNAVSLFILDSSPDIWLESIDKSSICMNDVRINASEGQVDQIFDEIEISSNNYDFIFIDCIDPLYLNNQSYKVISRLMRAFSLSNEKKTARTKYIIGSHCSMPRMEYNLRQLKAIIQANLQLENKGRYLRHQYKYEFLVREINVIQNTILRDFDNDISHDIGIIRLHGIKNSGKLYKEYSLLSIAQDGEIQLRAPHIVFKHLFSASQSDDNNNIEGKSNTSEQPSSSFNLKTSHDQKQQKSSVNLPFMAAQNTEPKKPSSIIYVPDLDDDFDDEDPDADLEF